MLKSSSSLFYFYRRYYSSFFFWSFSFSFSFFIFSSYFSSLLSGPFCSKCLSKFKSFSSNNFFYYCSFFNSSSLLLSFSYSSVLSLLYLYLYTILYWMRLAELGVWILFAEPGGLVNPTGRLAKAERSKGALPSSIIFNFLIYYMYSLSSASFGSSLTLGLFWMNFALLAYLRVLKVSS